MIELYQFYFSHYCEKARWALDYKGIPYRPKNLLPGLHVKIAKALAPKTCLPIISDGQTVVQDSTEIITFLDEKFSDCQLTPQDFDEAKQALAWEEFLDEEIGVTLRLWVYYHILPDRQRALRFLLDGAPRSSCAPFAEAFPDTRNRMMDFMNINAETAKQSKGRFLAALERLDDSLKDRRFLVGDCFSRADLTACALLSTPFIRPGKPDAQAAEVLPEPVLAMRDRHNTRPHSGWVRYVQSLPAAFTFSLKAGGHLSYRLQACCLSRS
jgi:glutathione S-transferase